MRRKRNRSESGLLKTSISKYSLIFIFILNAVGSLFGQSSDFLIINQPQSLQILNKYEQSLTISELARLAAFLPVEILDSKVQLSDNYTFAYKIRFGGTEYFLPQSITNQLLKEKHASLIENVFQVGDTISILEDNKFTLKTPDPEKSDQISIPKNTRVIRIFRKRNDYYVLVPGTINKYGWIRFQDNKYWIVIHHISNRPLLDTTEILNQVQDDDLPNNEIFINIISKTRKVNALFSDLFRELNTRTGSSKSTPSWTVAESEEKLELQFIPHDYEMYFSRSNARFIQEIEYLLLGSKYRLEPAKQTNKFIIHAPQIN
jgi:hypothetical protein